MIRRASLAFALSAVSAIALCGAGPALAQAVNQPKPGVRTLPPPPPAAQPQVPVAPPAPDLPRTVFIQSMDSEFRKRDTNGDGKITRAELEQFERMTQIAQAQANNRALFDRLDADRNGVLTPGEFAALVQDPGTPDVSGLMMRFDANRDQNISLVEYRSATLANFDKLDTDKDGVVTDAEMKAANVHPTGPTGR